MAIVVGALIKENIVARHPESQGSPEIAGDPLLLDVVEWIAREPRRYSEVIDTWRTSCPRLTIWEDAVDAGYVTRHSVPGSGVMVVATEPGRKWLREHGRRG